MHVSYIEHTTHDGVITNVRILPPWLLSLLVERNKVIMKIDCSHEGIVHPNQKRSPNFNISFIIPAIALRLFDRFRCHMICYHSHCAAVKPQLHRDLPLIVDGMVVCSPTLIFQHKIWRIPPTKKISIHWNSTASSMHLKRRQLLPWNTCEIPCSSICWQLWLH